MSDDLREIGSGGGFAECPPDVECPLGFDIVRTPAKGSFDCLCLSTVALGKYCHWWNGRTQPCDGEQCSKCLQGSPRRWHSWVAVYSERTQRTFILEVPGGPAKALADFRSKNGTLRGVGIQVHRANGKVNGPVRIGFGKARADNVLLPEAPDVEQLLVRMWTSRLGDGETSRPATLTLVHQQDGEKRVSTG